MSLCKPGFLHLLLILLDRITGLLGRDLVLFARKFGDLTDEVDSHWLLRGEQRNVMPQ